MAQSSSLRTIPQIVRDAAKDRALSDRDRRFWAAIMNRHAKACRDKRHDHPEGPVRSGFPPDTRDLRD